MAQFFEGQIKTNEAVAGSISQLTSKVDAMATHQKAMDQLIAQLAQQVSHLSRPQGLALAKIRVRVKFGSDNSDNVKIRTKN